MSLRRQAVQGVCWSAVQNWGSSLATSVIILILARLLDREAFGLVAFATLFTAFLAIFQRQGFAQAIVQRADLQPPHLDTAFWTTVTLGSVMAAMLFTSAGVIAPWFEQAELGPILRWLSLTILIDSLGSTPEAVLRRSLSFRSLAIRSLSATVIGGVVGVYMALNGFGVWSLVGQRIASSVTGTAALWIASPWHPGMSVSARHLKDLFNFGVFVMGREIIGFFNRRSDDLVIFTFLGAEALGFYKIGRELLVTTNRLFTQTVSTVALPVFARLQHDHTRMRQALLSATKMTSLMAFPAFLGVFVLAPELVPGLFGPGWDESAPVMRLLALVGMVQCVTFFNNPVIMACGKPSWTLALTLVSAVGGLVLYLIAVRWGIAAVAAAHLIRNYAHAPLPIWLVHRLIGLKVTEYLRRYAVPLAGALFMAAIVWAAKHLLADLLDLHALLAVCVLIGAAVYVLAVRLGSPAHLSEAADYVRLALSSQKP